MSETRDTLAEILSGVHVEMEVRYMGNDLWSMTVADTDQAMVAQTDLLLDAFLECVDVMYCGASWDHDVVACHGVYKPYTEPINNVPEFYILYRRVLDLVLEALENSGVRFRFKREMVGFRESVGQYVTHSTIIRSSLAQIERKQITIAAPCVYCGESERDRLISDEDGNINCTLCGTEYNDKGRV